MHWGYPVPVSKNSEQSLHSLPSQASMVPLGSWSFEISKTGAGAALAGLEQGEAGDEPLQKWVRSAECCLVWVVETMLILMLCDRQTEWQEKMGLFVCSAEELEDLLISPMLYSANPLTLARGDLDCRYARTFGLRCNVGNP